MSASSDVLILGGGPAGSAAAIWAAQCGLCVTLVERSPFPRHRPGETLHPGIESVLDQLGVSAEVSAHAEIRHQGQTISWRGKTFSSDFGSDADGPWRGYQICRERFDTILLDRARRLGVTVWQPSAATEMPILSRGRVEGWACPGPMGARFVVDASGMRGVLRRALGLAQLEASSPLRSYYGYGVGDDDCQETPPSLVGNDRGWLWTARVGKRRFHWTRMNFRPGGDDRGCPPSLRGVHWQGPIRGADVTWRFVPNCAGPGYFIAGDAAAVLDPASSHGVLRALMSGIMAAHVASTIVSGQVRESDGIASYRDWLRAWFEHDARHLRELYGTALSAAQPDFSDNLSGNSRKPAQSVA
ncbi:FAD-dependent oxidoreductase [Mesorhizobium sp. M0815]|uniref:NAD(P)/FAD-dependent oxidoreductase n=1 Tax=Mesorhizobium sp. M0815 TaxID=2957005 RepID=UPI00333D5E5D